MKIRVWTTLLGALSLTVMINVQSANEVPFRCHTEEDHGEPFVPVEFKVVGQGRLYFYSALTGDVTYDRLFNTAPAQFDVILTNPPFGGKEGADAQTRFDFKTGATQVLFLQHIIKSSVGTRSNRRSGTSGARHAPSIA